MKTNEIITTVALTIANRTFKDERLAKATQSISAIYTDAAKYAEEKNREIAKILSDVALKKSYERDGFTSVADYAQTIFGIGRQNAYALASAGKVYNDPKANPELKAMTPSNLAEIVKMDTKVVEKALADGTINRNTTQKALRALCKSSKYASQSDKAQEVLDMFTVRPTVDDPTDAQMEEFSTPRTMPDWDKYFCDQIRTKYGELEPVELIFLPKAKVKPEDKKATVQRTLYTNSVCAIVVNFYKYAPTRKTTRPATSKPTYTLEQLRAMLAEAEANQVADSTNEREEE